MIDGNDESNWQTSLIRAPFHFFKASDGLHTKDSQHDAFVAQARADGEQPGHYHMLEPNEDPVAQMRWFVQCANPQPGDPMAIDYETNGCTEAEKDAALAALQQLEPTDEDGLYESYSWWLKGDRKYGDFLWIADYNGVKNFVIPQALFDQWSSTPNDQDIANFPTYAAFIAWCHAKENIDMALTSDDANVIWTDEFVLPDGSKIAAADAIKAMLAWNAQARDELAAIKAELDAIKAQVSGSAPASSSATTSSGISDADVQKIVAATIAAIEQLKITETGSLGA